MSNEISQSIVALFESERFYAELVSQMKRILSKKVPIAGVCIKDGIELHLNPDTFCKLPLEQRVSVLKHECEHILRDHISRGKELAPDVYTKSEDYADSIIKQMKHQSLNIAADAAINGGLPNLPDGAVYPHLFDLPKGQTFEWYLANLKDNKKAKDFMHINGHEIWAESEKDKDLLKEQVKQAVNKAAKRTKAAGKMTANNELLVEQFNQSTVNWREQLRHFAARTTQLLIDSSKKKRNRRYGVMYPGNIKIERLRIGCAVDTSGSMSDAAITQCMSEISKIAKYADVYVVEADSEIKNKYLFDPKKKYVVSGRGGTAYQPVFDFFKHRENQVDALIYLGDMDCFDTEVLKKPKYPVLWAIVGSKNPPATWGSKINIEINK